MAGAREAFREHEHGACAKAALARAEEAAKARGLRLTPVRRRALEILLEAHRAVGAYEILERLGKEGFGHQPPVAYRALDFLVQHGFAHRVRRLNAFIACMAPEHEGAPVLFICADCGKVAEIPEARVSEAIDAVAARLDFAVERASIEVQGRCPACRDVKPDVKPEV
ncbi:MAG: transcriptional repressor, partial [Alphaproteobacteria bacterium]